jgi:choline dehydrogenase-like flavoprotein
MAPGLDGLPAAEREIAVAGPVAEFLRSLSPRAISRIRLGLRAFEWLPFPWRFSRLRPAAREDFLRRMEGSQLAIHHELLLMAKVLSTLGYAVAPSVEARVGASRGCRLADGGTPEPPGPLGETRPSGEIEECDVVVVGSGAGGAVAAATLAEAGLDVIVLEAGESFDRDSYPEEPLAAIAALYRDGGLTIAEGRPQIPVPVGRTVGGTTVVNSGTCFRGPDQVLEDWRRRFDIGWVTDLEREFEQAERFLKVTPVDPERMGRNGQLTMEGAAAIGASGGPIARNAGNCVQCSSCPLGCEIDAKRGMHVSYLPRAVAAGARLRTGVEAHRIAVEGDRAVGISCPGYTVRARVATIVAGGALGTPELLLRSGLGGPTVGRHLHIHPACWVGARYPEQVRGWEGVMQSYYIDQWEPERLLLEATFTPLAFGGAWLPGTGAEHQRAMLEFDRVGSIGVHLSDESAGRVSLAGDGSLRTRYKLTREDTDRLAFGIARAAEIHFAAGATEVYPNIARAGTLRPSDLAAFETTRFKPSELRLEAFHPMGTARIAPPGEGVCAPDGSVHGTDDLYVADASLFPTSLGVNPMMTVIAFAHRIAAELAGLGQRESRSAASPKVMPSSRIAE